MALAQGLRPAVQTLAADAATAQVLAAFERAGVSALILRGPAVARLLYDPNELRPYVDADLLVPPADRQRAEQALRELGFEPLATDAELKGHRPVHAHEWARARDHISVDLHRTLSGACVSERELWHALAACTREERVGGVTALLPEPPALALIVALHVAHNGPGSPKPLADLTRAVSRLDLDCWRQAAALAARLEALPALAAGLELAPGGPELAERLALPRSLPAEVALRAAGAPPVALGLEWWLGLHGWRRRLSLLAHVLVPPPGALKTWRPLARRGRRGLVQAYISQPFWLVRSLPRALRAVRSARKAAR